MSEILSTEDHGLPLTVAREIDQLCDRFEAEWQAGAEPIIEKYIADAAEPARHELVRELLKLDIHYRRERDYTLVPRDYAARFPEHASLIDTLLGAAPLPESPAGPTQAGRYGLEDEIGKGGMGKVFRAHDPDFRRSLAVKVLKEEYKDRPDMVARFLEEAQITGQLQHPGVPPVHEIGRLADGRPFLAMKLIEGRTLEDLLAERRDPAHDLPRFLTIFEQVCQTLAYAHARRFIHRDLKPANVMVGAFGEVQVMDWGLAKVLTPANTHHESSDAPTANTLNTPRSDTVAGPTEPGVVLGTLAYMPSEQARGEIDRVDERSDVFGLGAILCVILTGQPPYRERSQEKLWEQAKNADLGDAFARLDTCRADAELVALAKRCLAKGQVERPRDAAAVAEAVAAYQASVQERLRHAEMERAAAEVKAREERKRRRLAVISGSLVVLVVVGGLLATYWQYLKTAEERNRSNNLATEKSNLAEENGLLAKQERSERGKAEKLATDNGRLANDLQRQLKKTQEEAARLELHQALDLCQQGDVRRGMVLLAHALDPATKAEAADLQRAIRANLAVWRPQLPALKAVLPHQGEVLSVAFSPDGTQLVTGASDRTAQVWKTATGKPLGKPILHQEFTYRPDRQAGQVVTVAFSADGRAILTGTGPSKSSIWPRVGKLPGPRHFQGLKGRLPGLGTSLDFSHGYVMPARLWDASKGNLLNPTFGLGSRFGLGSGEQESTWVVAFSPDGRTILTGGGHIQRNNFFRPPMSPFETGGLAGSPLGGMGPLNREPEGGYARFWDAATGRPLYRPILQDEAILTGAFSPNGKWVVTGGADGTAQILEVSTGKPVGPPLEHKGPVVAAAFSPDGSTILTASCESLTQGTVQLWDAVTAKPLGQLPNSGLVTAATFSPDGRAILTGGGDPLLNKGEAQLWDAATRRPLTSPLPHQGLVYAVAFSPDSQSLVTASADKTARIWETTTHKAINQLLWYENAVACRPDGQALLRGLEDKKVQLCEAPSGKPLGTPFPYPVDSSVTLFSPDGHRVLIWGLNGPGFQLCEAATGEGVGQPFRPRGSVRTVVFSPDGRLVLTGTGKSYDYDPEPNEAQIWEAATGKPLLERPLEHKAPIRAAAFSPDGRMVVTAGQDQTAQICDTTTGKPIGQPLSHHGAIHAVAFSPNGRTVITGSDDRTARLWDAATGNPVSDPLAHLGAVRTVAFSPDGATVVTGSDDHTARLWNVATGRAIGQALQHGGNVRAMAFSPDSGLVATGSQDGIVRLWVTATGTPIADALQHPGPVLSLVFSRKGRTLLVRTWERASTQQVMIGNKVESSDPGPWGSSLTVWQVPGIAEGSVEQITLWAQVLTGLEVDDNGVSSFLDERTWQDRHQHLLKLGDALTVSEDSLTWHRREAADSEARGQWYAAAWHLERLVRAEPAQWQVHNRLGRAWTMLGVWDKALAETGKATLLGKDKWQPWHNQGVAHALQGQREKALEDFSEALKRGANNWQPWHQRGRVYAQMGQWDNAAADFGKATTLPEDPGGIANIGHVKASADAWADLALIRLQLKDKQGYMGACAYLRTAFEKTLDPNGAAQIAWVSALTPALEKASEVSRQLVELAQRAAAANPDDYRLMRSLGASLYRAGLFDAAVQQLSAALTARKQPAPSAWIFLAMAHHRLGNKDEAQKWLEKSVRWIENGRQTNSAQGANQNGLSWSNLPWTERLALELLQHEAEALVRDKSGIPVVQGQPQFHWAHALSLARAGEHAKAVALANALAQSKDVTGAMLYDHGRVCALSAAAVKDDAKLQEQYAARAVALLRQAVSKGFKDTPSLKGDKNLDALRDREDFKKLLAELNIGKDKKN